MPEPTTEAPPTAVRHRRAPRRPPDGHADRPARGHRRGRRPGRRSRSERPGRPRTTHRRGQHRRRVYPDAERPDPTRPRTGTRPADGRPARTRPPGERHPARTDAVPHPNVRSQRESTPSVSVRERRTRVASARRRRLDPSAAEPGRSHRRAGERGSAARGAGTPRQPGRCWTPLRVLPAFRPSCWRSLTAGAVRRRQLDRLGAVHALLLLRHGPAVRLHDLDTGAVPYLDSPVEYPVLTGGFMAGGRRHSPGAPWRGACCPTGRPCELLRRHLPAAVDLRAAPAATAVLGMSAAVGRGDGRAVPAAVRARLHQLGPRSPSPWPPAACGRGRGGGRSSPVCCSGSASPRSSTAVLLLGALLSACAPAAAHLAADGGGRGRVLAGGERPPRVAGAGDGAASSGSTAAGPPSASTIWNRAARHLPARVRRRSPTGWSPTVLTPSSPWSCCCWSPGSPG